MMLESHHNLKLAISLVLFSLAIGGSLWISQEGDDSRVDFAPKVPLEQVSQSTSVSKDTQTRRQAPETVATLQPNVVLKDIYVRSTVGSKFELPSMDEVQAFESLLTESIEKGFQNVNLREHWIGLGWKLSHDVKNKWIVIEELESQRRGRGLYALRLSDSDPIMVQAPHRFFDTDTGKIVRLFFSEFPVKAAAWNSVHRKQFDIAHESRSFFNAFTRVVVDANPEITNFQIHGFDASKRTTKSISESPETFAIVSNATKFPNQQTKEFAKTMKTTFGKSRVWLFPQETLELGATTNQQASVMRNEGSGKFLHLELSKPFRNVLVDSSDVRSKLYGTLRAAARDTYPKDR